MALNSGPRRTTTAPGYLVSHRTIAPSFSEDRADLHGYPGSRPAEVEMRSQLWRLLAIVVSICSETATWSESVMAWPDAIWQKLDAQLFSVPTHPATSLFVERPFGAHGHARELGSVLCYDWGPENPIFRRTSSTSDVVVIIQFRASRGVELLQRASPALAASVATSRLICHIIVPSRIPIASIYSGSSSQSPSLSLTPHRVTCFCPSICLSVRYPPIPGRTMGAEYSGCWHTLPPKHAAHGSAVRSIPPHPPSNIVALWRASAKAGVPCPQ